MAEKRKLSRQESLGTLRKVLAAVRPYLGLLILSFILSAVTVGLTLYVPILFGEGIDLILGAGRVDFAGLAPIMLRIAILVGITGIGTYLMGLLNNHMAYGIVRDLRDRAMAHIQRLPLAYLDRHSTGDIVSRVIADADQLSEGLLLGFTQLFGGLVTILVTLVFMLRLSPPVTLLVLVLTPLSFLVARFIATRSYHMFRLQSEARGQQTALVEEMIGGGQVVRAFGYEARAAARFDEINGRLQEYSQKAVFYSSLTNPSTRFVNSVIYAAVALAGALLILAGHVTVGGLTVLLSYANQYMKPFNDISSVVTEFQNALACAARIFQLMEQETESPDPEASLSEVTGAVDMEGVHFSYVPERPLIQDLTLHVTPGMRIAIVGPTGCGKTTLINLLMRFYDVQEGRITVDSTDVRDVSRHSLRQNYGMVLQDTWIRHDTVRNNIALGRPEATDAEILEAAKKSHSYEFIRRLPQGLDTVITEDSLSQGQKQLLCITRVMLTLPPMLILDEATSSIDTLTEIRIQEAFARMMEGRTSFVVAHRLSTIRSADRILVMRDGHVLEQGSHQELMALGGFYRELYMSQFEGEGA